MAIIKCPECGHQISDKAPVCPSCGVEIAGKIIRCPQCGEVYFKNQPMCPNCHHATVIEQPAVAPAASQPAHNVADVQNTSANVKPQNTQRPPQASGPAIQAAQPVQAAPAPQPVRNIAAMSSASNAGMQAGNAGVRRPNNNVAPSRPTTPPVPPVTPGNNNNNSNANNEPPKKKKNHVVLVTTIVILLAFCFVGFYLYQSANKNKELEAYEQAMDSNDPLVLQNYLNTYGDAPEAHRDSIEAHLLKLQQTDNDWNNAVISGSKTALEDYLNTHPNSPHRQDAIHKIDSIDWQTALAANTLDAYNSYLDEHASGEHADDAKEALKALNAKNVTPQERQAISTVFRHFFQSINSRNEDGLQSTVSSFLTSFLGKPDATKSDVVTFMNKIYKDDITNMTWRINNDYKINKKEVGDQEYEYAVQFSATQEVEKTDADQPEHTKFRISATVGPDGLISSLNMVKILQ